MFLENLIVLHVITAENEKDPEAKPSTSGVQIRSRPSKSDKLLGFLETQQKALEEQKKEDRELKERALEQQRQQGAQLLDLMSQLAQVKVIFVGCTIPIPV